MQVVMANNMWSRRDNDDLDFHTQKWTSIIENHIVNENEFYQLQQPDFF